MDTVRYNFMVGVLGADGAEALRKAAERSATLENALVPRTIVAWLNSEGQYDYDGNIPGIESTHIRFEKNEQGYTGTIGVAGDVYSFRNAPATHVAASIAVAIGVDTDKIDQELRATDLYRLGKSIDLLAKTAMFKRLQKAEGPGPSHAPTPQGEATEAKGPIKQPTQAKPPPPTPPTPKAPIVPPLKPLGKPPFKGVKLPILRVTKSQADTACPTCRQRQFQGNRFSGCICFRELAKHTDIATTLDGYMLRFKPAWDQEAISTLTETLGVL